MISSFLKYLSTEKRYSTHTIGAYRKDLEQFSSFLLNTYEISDLVKVTHPHIRDWVVTLADDDLSPRSVNRKIATLKSFFKFLLSRDEIMANPAAAIQPLKVSKELPSFLKESEVRQLLDGIDFEEDFSGKRDQLLFELFYATGLRLSEMLNISVSDINLGERTVRVLGKRNKERVLPLSERMTKIISVYIQMRAECGFDEDFLILTDRGKKAYPMFVQRKFRAYLTGVTTLRKKSPHIMRHSFATHLLNEGADLNAVKDLLGHSGLAATQVYTHNSIEKLKVAFEKAHPKA